MNSVVPAEVQQFVRNHIRSLDELEVLLLVSALPDREWSVDAVYGVVLSNPALVLKRLEGFVEAGFLTRSGEPPLYRFAPRSEDLAAMISAVGTAYRMSRHRIVELIYSRPDDPLVDFSQAFQFKRDQ